jgi:hypothetical protein
VANLQVKDGAGSTKYMSATGDGTDPDPHIPQVAVASLAPGSGATSLGKAEDGAHSSGDVGVMALAVRTDTPTARSGTDGDYEPLQVKDGQAWVRVADGSDAALGAQADSAAATDTGTASLIGLFKRLLQRVTTLMAQLPSALTGSGNLKAAVVEAVGASSIANGQVSTSTTAANIVSSRSTRRYVTIKNLDSTITVYVGVATVSAANGMPLAAGESITLDCTAAIQGIAASGTPAVAYLEVYG